jgi:hypothetical protein
MKLPPATGTKGQLAGKEAGTSKGKGSSGAVPKTAPEETDAKTLKDLGIDENLAKRARKAGAMSEDKYEAATKTLQAIGLK